MSIETLERKVDKMFVVINGNGKIGLGAKVQIMWEGRKTRNGLYDWAFRVLIMIVVSFIAVKVGLR